MTLQLEANCVIEFDLSLLIALDYLRIIIVLFIIYFARLVFPKALYLYGNSILYHFRVYANAIIKEQDRVNVHHPHLVTFSRCHIWRRRQDGVLILHLPPVEDEVRLRR